MDVTYGPVPIDTNSDTESVHLLADSSQVGYSRNQNDSRRHCRQRTKSGFFCDADSEPVMSHQPPRYADGSDTNQSSISSVFEYDDQGAYVSVSRGQTTSGDKHYATQEYDQQYDPRAPATSQFSDDESAVSRRTDSTERGEYLVMDRSNNNGSVYQMPRLVSAPQVAMPCCSCRCHSGDDPAVASRAGSQSGRKKGGRRGAKQQYTSRQENANRFAEFYPELMSSVQQLVPSEYSRMQRRQGYGRSARPSGSDHRRTDNPLGTPVFCKCKRPGRSAGSRRASKARLSRSRSGQMKRRDANNNAAVARRLAASSSSASVAPSDDIQPAIARYIESAIRDATFSRKKKRTYNRRPARPAAAKNRSAARNRSKSKSRSRSKTRTPAKQRRKKMAPRNKPVPARTSVSILFVSSSGNLHLRPVA